MHGSLQVEITDKIRGGFSGQASDIAIHAREILRIREQLNKIYQSHMSKSATCPKSLEEINSLMERDYFMTAQEAVNLGLCDQILSKRERIPNPDQS